MLLRTPLSLALALTVGTVTVLAHDPGLSSLRLEATADSVQATVVIASKDLTSIVALDTNNNGRIDPSEVAAAQPALLKLAETWIEVKQAGNGLPVHARGAGYDATSGDITLRAVIDALPRETCTVRFARFGELPPNHREFLTVAVADGMVVSEQLVSENQPPRPFTWPTFTSIVPGAAPAHARNTFSSFFVLGVDHILTGYDHLLYLAALVLACGAFRSILAIITSFTLAHSITLGLATLGLVEIPSHVVEPLIAATIVWVGVENLRLRGEEPRRRWLLAFGFGLIHGFGFASVLRELGIASGGGGIAIPLVSFNLGVEAGQLAVVSVTLPILLYARRSQNFLRWGVPALSGVVAMAGAYWLIERLG